MGFCLGEVLLAVADDALAHLKIVLEAQLEVLWYADDLLDLEELPADVELRDAVVAVAQEHQVNLSDLVQKLILHLLASFLALLADAVGELQPKAEVGLDRKQAIHALLVVPSH